ncbi:hypothetical protein M011DRAFT_9561 [Sporormia fimetaria CBS 119925]|uniref:WSC domain-containing protein n=1 Tax=Sporormia fimetaria CBS 119925 TaxID=1340428 RepID=A0A6A6VP17_9PLEO|nr:hypothetical protein M011DRAFT_9561 [Sporormia fimetaria CBS 119925]
MVSRCLLALSVIIFAPAMGSPAYPEITNAAILPRDHEYESSLIGYYWVTSGSKSSLASSECDSGFFFYTSYSRDNYYVCCCPMTTRSANNEYTYTTHNCWNSVITACDGETAYYGSTSGVCANSCNTDTIYRYSTVDANALMWLGCDFDENGLMWQETPVEALEASTTTREESSTSTLKSTSSTSQSSDTPSSGPVQTPNSDNPPIVIQSSSDGSEKSKAWIAGPAVGGAAILAIAGFLVFLFLRHRRQKEQKYHQAPQTVQVYPSPPTNGSYIGTSGPMSPQSAYAETYKHEGLVSSISVAHDAQSWRENGHGRTASWVQHPGQGSPGGRPVTMISTAASDLPELVTSPRR